MNLHEFENDWRNMGQLDYLYGKKFKYMNYLDAVIITNREHEHCEFCWETISSHLDAINVGYCTDNLYRWVCPNCFNELKQLFHWEVV